MECKTIYFIDTENQGTQYIEELATLGETDRVILMYTDYGPKFSYQQIEYFIKTKAKVKMEYCFSGTPNALDFQISTRIGSLLKESLMYEDAWEAQNMLTFGSLTDARKSIKVIIISEDKGYYPLVEYWVARGYNVAIRNSICGEDADVKGYLRELSISKQLETQQAYLEKSGLTISEASKEMPEIKIPNKDAKTKGSCDGAVTEQEKTEVLVSVFKEMLAEFQKSEETRLSKLINDRCVMKEDISNKDADSEMNISTPDMEVVPAVATDSTPVKAEPDADKNMRDLMLSEVEDELKGNFNSPLEVPASIVESSDNASVVQIETPDGTAIVSSSGNDTCIETSIEVSESAVKVETKAEGYKLDLIMQQPKAKLSDIIPTVIDSDLTPIKERSIIKTNADKIKGVIKVTKNEAIILGYISYYSRSPEEFTKVATKYMTTKEGKKKANSLVGRFTFGFLSSKYKEGKSDEK